MTDTMDDVALKARPTEAETKPGAAARKERANRLREIAHRLGTEAVARALDQAA